MSEVCACLRDVTDEHDVVIALCEPCSAKPDLGIRIIQLLDYELDHLVKECAGGRRSKWIWGDPATERQ